MLEALQASVVAGWVFVVLALCAIGIIALLLGGLWMYRDAQSRRMDATIWVVLLVLATLIGGIIGFAIVFVIYLVVRESHPIGGAVSYGYAPPMYPPSQGPRPTTAKGGTFRAFSSSWSKYRMRPAAEWNPWSLFRAMTVPCPCAHGLKRFPCSQSLPGRVEDH